MSSIKQGRTRQPYRDGGKSEIPLARLGWLLSRDSAKGPLPVVSDKANDDKDSKRKSDPWAEHIEAAEALVHAAQGDTLAAREVLEQAVVGLHEVIAGRAADPERIVYLRFLAEALHHILSGVKPDKALGIWSGGRPREVSEDRDLAIFVAVGARAEELASKVDDPVTQAQLDVSDAKRVGIEVVKKAWASQGGLKNWQRIRKSEKSQ